METNIVKIIDVYLELEQPLSAAERGTVLLDAEDYLRKNIHDGIRIWLQPMGDKNSLRKLRGIEMK